MPLKRPYLFSSAAEQQKWEKEKEATVCWRARYHSGT
jgi:hypothetical protein